MGVNKVEEGRGNIYVEGREGDEERKGGKWERRSLLRVSMRLDDRLYPPSLRLIRDDHALKTSLEGPSFRFNCRTCNRVIRIFTFSTRARLRT